MSPVLVWLAWLFFWSFVAGVLVAESKLDRLLLRIMGWARGKARSTLL